MSTVRHRPWAVVTTASVAAALAFASVASATNLGSVSGNNTVGCDVAWDAASVMNTNLSNDDPDYPNLMAYPNGDPIASYSNGGYITEVRPETGDPGIFEITHWYGGATPPGDLITQTDRPVYWRLPVSTDETIRGAVLTVTLPRGFDFVVSSGSDIARWGAPYSDYAWVNPSIQSTSDSTGLIWTFQLGDLAASSGVVVQLSGVVPTGTVLSEHSVATAQLTGTYDPSIGCASVDTTTSTTEPPSETTTSLVGVTTTSTTVTPTTAAPATTVPPSTSTTSIPSSTSAPSSTTTSTTAMTHEGALGDDAFASTTSTTPGASSGSGNASAANSSNAASAGSPATLASTGAAIWGLLALGTGLVTIGLILVPHRRRA